MSKPFKIFIVEDDAWYSEVLEYILKLNPEYEVIKFSNGKECLDNLHTQPDLITLDYSLDDMTGAEVLKQVKTRDPNVQVVVVSGQDDVTTAVDLLRDGAYDYIVKDNEAKDRLWNAVNRIREAQEMKEEIAVLRQEVGKKYNFDNLIGVSPLMARVKLLMEKACRTKITVSITGETGTGKEVVAKGIHYNAAIKNAPFVAVNVAAIPSELIESELFGYEKGAFTGAQTARVGKFEEANGGTLFLDEVGEMDLNMQTKLLRAIQEREVVRIGSNTPKSIDVRLIVATHKNLADEVQKGNFREDLFYRLLGLPIELPPLRDRGNDVLILARHFLDVFAKENQLGEIELDSEAKTCLTEYPFPGNIRELKAVVELAAVMCSNEIIRARDLTFNSSRNMSDFLMEEKTLREYTNNIIRHFLEKYENNVLLVARKLDIGKSTIYRMIKNAEI
ncbi:MAG: sigma-54-dependent Fis family transcriptional regulator [Flavobacteriales bacterium]|nr:sigma-54-dependent Fis family transcriptional regulator [Flavobacteriales bacterium]